MPSPKVVLGRYAVFDVIASGGMAVVHVGRLVGPAGFGRTVAIKRLHGGLAEDPSFTSMLLDEARVASRVRHPNVVSVVDVVLEEGEIALVMEYVHGQPLGSLLRTSKMRREPVPLALVSAIATGMLWGLDAAHEAVSEAGKPLGLVHRDVSPQNVIVDVDGVARVLDFGIAKAASRLHTTRDDSVRGKVAYMAPEQLERGRVDRRTDVFAASIVLWEMLIGDRLFATADLGATAHAVLTAKVPAPSTKRADVPAALDAIVMRGLERDPAARFQTAAEMARAIEAAVPPASRNEVARWVGDLAGRELAARADRIREIESSGLAPAQAPGPKRGIDDERAARVARSQAATASIVLPITRLPDEPHPQATPRSRRKLFLLGGVVGALAVAALARPLVMRSPALAASAAPLSAVSPAPLPSALPTTKSTDPPPSSSASVVLAPVSPAPVSSAAAPRGKGAPTRAAGPARPSGDCDPPFYWDKERGIKVFKAHCMR